MLRSLFRAFFSPAAPSAKSLPDGVKSIDVSQLKQVSGGAPRGGWLSTEGAGNYSAPRGGW